MSLWVCVREAYEAGRRSGRARRPGRLTQPITVQYGDYGVSNWTPGPVDLFSVRAGMSHELFCELLAKGVLVE